MLEDALKNDKNHPGEIALAMLTFIQAEMPAGGNAAENRFFRLYGLLCERIFGKILGRDDNYRHEAGGWMHALHPWSQRTTMPSSSVGQTAASPSLVASRQNVSLDADPVVQLLGTAGKSHSREMVPPTLIEAISKESESRPNVCFPFPFHALPSPTQTAWLTLVDVALGGGQVATAAAVVGGGGGISSSTTADSGAAAVCTENDTRLLRDLLRWRPLEQKELELYRRTVAVLQQQREQQQQRPPLQISPRGGLNFNVMQRSPPYAAHSSNNISNHTSIAGSPTIGTATKSVLPGDEHMQPNVLFSMMENYLITFVRYPIAAPRRDPAIGPHPTPSASRHQPPIQQRLMQKKEPYGDAIYFHIFRRMLRHFLPYTREDHRDISFLSIESVTVASAVSRNNSGESELFLRIIIALWLEAQCRLRTTQQVVEGLQERHRRAGFVDPPVLDALSLSHDFVQGSYEPIPSLVHKCLRSLLVHALLDPMLESAILSAGAPQRQQEPRELSLSSSSSSGYLTACMTALQQPMYNWFRANLARASVHVSDSPFFGALSLWLMWLEPWNVSPVHRKDYSPREATQRLMRVVGTSTTDQTNNNRGARTLSFPTANQPSRYDPKWEPYIAANLFHYVVPLAIFLRRAREFDFSTTRFDASVQVVQRVFRVFSPSVVDAISRHLAGDPSLAHLVNRHMAVLGSFGPPRVVMSLVSYQKDMHSLLEEIHTQHSKKVQDLDILDRLIGRIEGIVGRGAVVGEERAVEGLVERARVIAHLPHTYQIFPGNDASRASGTARRQRGSSENDAFRRSDGKLTVVGREQLFRGQKKCRSEDVEYQGDKMRARPRSYEVAWLVHITVQASDWCNTRLHLTGEPLVLWWNRSRQQQQQHREGSDYFRIRVNLRFLADYRNLFFLFVVVYITSKIYSFG